MRRMTIMLDSIRPARLRPERRTTIFTDAFLAEKSPHKKHIVQLASNFLYTSESLDDKINALARIGHICYTGKTTTSFSS